MNYEEKYKQAIDRAMNLFVTNNISATAACKIFPELNESEEVNYERKYKEALGWMQSIYDGLHGATREDAEHYFPELKDEDERIRKWLIDWAKAVNWSDQFTITKEQVIAWLEKQGEKKPTDEVEPKFKVGNWITDGYIYYKITEILDDRYIIESKYDKRGAILFEYENRYHLWTIEDAKDGDVLINWNNTTFIFRAIEDETVKFHIAYNEKWDTIKTPSTKLSHLGLPESQFEFHPATKEQRDLLFSKMKETGYEWDSEKKELKKIEI